MVVWLLDLSVIAIIMSIREYYCRDIVTSMDMCIILYKPHTNIFAHLMHKFAIPTAFSTVYSRGAVKSTATRSISKDVNNKSVSIIIAYKFDL